MAVGPPLGNEVGESSRDHLTVRCRRLLQRWRPRGRGLTGTVGCASRKPSSPLNEQVGVADLPGYQIGCDLYCGTPKRLDFEEIDPCRRNASTSVACRSQGTDLPRVDQASWRGILTLRRPMVHWLQGGWMQPTLKLNAIAPGIRAGGLRSLAGRGQGVRQ